MSLWSKNDTRAGAPKFLKDPALYPAANTARDYGGLSDTKNIENAYYVDIVEAQDPLNRAKGIKSPGWIIYKEYGNGRKYIETLAAFKSYANTAGDAGVERISAYGIIAGADYVVVTVGNTDFTTVGGANAVANTFIATGPAMGTGTVVKNVQIPATSIAIGNQYLIMTSTGNNNFTSIGAAANTVGTAFTATGLGTGTDKVVLITGDNQVVANT